MADKNSYLSRVTYKGGKDSYEFPFSYLRKDFVKAQIDVSENESNTLAYMVDYTIDGHTLNLTRPVDADKTITIYRETSSTPLVEYEDSSILRAYDLNLSQRQNLNILEEQTDIVEKNYSLSQDTKDYMYKNLMDTKTAIDNKMSETLDTVNASVSTMNDIVNTTKESVEDSLAEMNTTVANTKKSVEDSLAEMNTTVANTKKSVEDSLATTTTNLNDAINTATSSMDSKIAQTSQALKDTENRVNETKADITKLAAEFKESESSLQDAIKNINSTNRNMSYEVGDQIHSSYLPFNCYITCVTAGTTGDTLPVIPEGNHDSGFTYTDGTATFKMDYWPLSVNGKKPLNKAGDITISKLATPRKIELTGNVTGSANFDGSKNIQIVAATPLCVPLAEHITWTVTGTNQGDFDSLQTALNEAKKYRPITEGALITIKLLSGFELDEPICVSRCDLRHVEITAEDSKVIANTSKVAALMPTVPNYSLWSVLNYLLFIQFYKAFAPTLRFKLKKDDSSAGSYHNCNGVDYNYSQGFIDGASFEGFRIGNNECYAVSATCSNISVKESTFNDNWGDITATKNSSLHVRNSTCTGALNRGIAVWGGVGAIEGCTITGCGQYGIIFAHCSGSLSEHNTESDSADTRRTKISNCGRGGIDAELGAHVAVNRIDITGCRTGVLLEGSGNLVGIGADTNISGNTNNYSIALNTITSLGLILAS